MSERPDLARGSFTYANPATIIWGPGCVAERLPGLLSRFPAERVFLVTTRSVAANGALIEPLRARLGARLVGEWSAIGQHAPARDVAAAAESARVANPTLLLSFGGGSPIDAAKEVAFSLASGLDFSQPGAAAKAREMTLGVAVIPHVAIPTTLSVAELGAGAGFSAPTTNEKVGVSAPQLLPAAVLYDGSLALHTPLALWLSTGIRAVDHAVEGMLSSSGNAFSDTLALEGLRRLQRGLLATHADPGAIEARTQAQLGAWFSFTLPAQSAAGLSHTLGKRIGSRFGIPHGVTSCLLLPHVMRFVAARWPVALRRVAEALGVDTSAMEDQRAALSAADAVGDLIDRLGLPRQIRAFGLAESDLIEAARPVASSEHPLEALVGIYRAAW